MRKPLRASPIFLALSIAVSAVPSFAQSTLPPSWGSTTNSPAATHSKSSTASPQPADASTPTPPQAQSSSSASQQPTVRPHKPTNLPPPGAGIGDSSASWIDVTAPLDPAITPVYEGNAPIQFNFIQSMNRGDPLDLSGYSIGAHSGTHVDAPMHFIRGGAPIDQVPLATLMGPALVINIDPRVIAITADELNRYPWRGSERILFRTRNSVNAWMVDPHFHRDFTFLAPDAAQLLADNGVKLVGIDYLSIEQFGSTTFRTHIILLGRGIPVVEGLDLRAVPSGEYDFIVLPLKIVGHEAAPARAVLRPR
jgi:arylformamidase